VGVCLLTLVDLLGFPIYLFHRILFLITILIDMMRLLPLMSSGSTITIMTLLLLSSSYFITTVTSFYTMTYTGTNVVFPRGTMRLLSIDPDYNYGYQVTSSAPIDILVYGDTALQLIQIYIVESGNPSTTGFWNTTSGKH
jgi:hypothetical protein